MIIFWMLPIVTLVVAFGFLPYVLGHNGTFHFKTAGSMLGILLGGGDTQTLQRQLPQMNTCLILY